MSLFARTEYNQLTQMHLQYAIMPKIRNNDKLDRGAVISQVANLVGDRHTVDLTHPQVSILIEGVHSFVGISVITEMIEYKRFNLEALMGPSAAPTEEDPARKEDAVSHIDAAKEERKQNKER